MIRYKLGKKPARDAVKFRLASFVEKARLPAVPASFGHEGLIGRKGWYMLANDRVGNCVFAGAAHEHMMHGRIAKNPVLFDSVGVNSDYSAVTGFDPRRPETDVGTDMQQAASYRRRIGVVDTKGLRHRVAAYLAIDPGNVEQLYQAVYLFGCVGIGIQFPSSAMDQFERGQPWDVVDGSPIEGGHYIPLVSKRHAELRVVTWGAIQPMTEAFYKRYCDEVVAYVFTDSLMERKSPEGFAYEELIAALAALR